MATYNPEIDIKLICQKLVELENRLSEVEVTLLGLGEEIKQNKGERMIHNERK